MAKFIAFLIFVFGTIYYYSEHYVPVISDTFESATSFSESVSSMNSMSPLESERPQKKELSAEDILRAL